MRYEETKGEAKLGAWAFRGDCCPVAPGVPCFSRQETFSVGIFQWQKKARGGGMKPGKVVKRVTGWISDPEAVYNEARSYIVGRSQMTMTEDT